MPPCRSWTPPPAPPASRSTTSAAPRTTASRWPACSPAGLRLWHSNGRGGGNMAKHHITATVNGDPVEFLCETEDTLLDCLRDQLGLTGTKEGCGTGDCGACSVTVDGRLVCSCLMLGVEVDGRSIGTIEGMANGEQLHPLQRKFLEHAALQCGVCTPGF